jgi:hypothetical protein
MSGVGALAAISSSLLMTVGFIVWDQNWKGSVFHLNLFKCALASILFLLVAFFLSTPSRWAVEDVVMLCISSFIGIVIGDLLWLQVFRIHHLLYYLILAYHHLTFKSGAFLHGSKEGHSS